MMMRKYFELQKAEVPVSVRTYAALVGVTYYTFRDWYRNYKASAEYKGISTGEYSRKRMAGSNVSVKSAGKSAICACERGIPIFQDVRQGRRLWMHLP